MFCVSRKHLDDTKTFGGFGMIREVDLRATLSPGRLKPVYLLVGNDPYLTKHYAGMIAKKTTGDSADLNHFALPENAGVQEIYDSLFQLSFTGERICVTVSNFDFEGCPIAKFKELQSLVEQAPDRNVLVLYYDVLQINTKKSDRFKKLAKSVEAGGGIVCELNHKNETELTKMLCDGAAKRRAHLDAPTARYMVSVCSNDLNILLHELEKAADYVGADGAITKEIIDKVCIRTVEASVYDMSRHILAGRAEQAFYLLEQLLAEGISPAEIHSLIASAYVDIFRVKAALDAGKKAESIAAEFGYSPARSFVLTNAARDGRRLTNAQIDQVLKVLLAGDAAVKNDVKISGSGAKIALETIITKILRITGGRR